MIFFIHDLILVYKKGISVTLNPQYTKRENWDSHYSLYLEKNEKGEYVLGKLIDKLKQNLILSFTKKSYINRRQ